MYVCIRLRQSLSVLVCSLHEEDVTSKPAGCHCDSLCCFRGASPSEKLWATIGSIGDKTDCGGNDMSGPKRFKR